MELLKAALFGILQGLTEFLPVSSSGHLSVFNRLFNYAPGGDFLFHVVCVHAATLIAVCFVFRRDIASLFTSNRRVVLLLAVGTIPAGLFGMLAREFFEQAGSNMVLVGLGFLTSALFLLAGRRGAGARKGLASLSIVDSIAVGFAQALAILPGVSRSGSTISTARCRGVESATAASFSFLLMIPAVGGAALLDARKLFTGGIECDPLPLAISFVSALVVAVIALRLLLKLLQRGSFFYFSYYLIPLGTATIAYGLAE